MIEILHYLKDTINYGMYGIFLTMGNAGFISSTVHPEYKTRVHEPPGLQEVSELGLGLGFKI